MSGRNTTYLTNQPVQVIVSHAPENGSLTGQKVSRNNWEGWAVDQVLLTARFGRNGRGDGVKTVQDGAVGSDVGEVKER